MTAKRRRISTLGSRVTSLVSVALVLILIGLALMSSIVGRSITDDLKRNLSIVVKMDSNASDSDINTLKQFLLASEPIALFSYISAEDILAEESAYLGDDIASILDNNPYQPEFDIKVRVPFANSESISLIMEDLRMHSGVAEVLSDTAVIEGLESTLERLAVIMLSVAAVLMIISVILIYNIISLSIYSKRFVIHTMRLVGATGGFIRAPFIRSAAWSGVLAGTIASIAVALCCLYLAGYDAAISAALTWQHTVWVYAALIAAGALICALTAVVATNRYLRASYDDMFLK